MGNDQGKEENQENKNAAEEHVNGEGYSKIDKELNNNAKQAKGRGQSERSKPVMDGIKKVLTFQCCCLEEDDPVIEPPKPLPPDKGGSAPSDGLPKGPVDPNAPLLAPEERKSKAKIPIPGFEANNEPERRSVSADEIELDPFAPAENKEQQSAETKQSLKNPFDEVRPETPLGDIPSDIFLDLLADKSASGSVKSDDTPQHLDFITTTGEAPVAGAAAASEGNPFTAYLEGENLADFLDGGGPTADTSEQKS